MNIWVNGCFDVLHIGHIRLLEYARSKGDRLIVGIDTDRRVKRLKGETRPFNRQEDRREMLMSLKSVDDVFIFDSEEEMYRLLQENNIGLIVVGDDYRDKKVYGDHLAPVDFFSKLPGHSTTSILQYSKDI
jgi:D-beta-D-heptose 7-phosphate kinase/D-beta-D-heptose 1-phosphate adenosyltransferase